MFQLTAEFLPTDLPGLDFKSIKRPIFETEIPDTDDGNGRRTSLQPRVRWYWQLDYEFVILNMALSTSGTTTQQGVDELFAFWARFHGSGLGFLYRDPDEQPVPVGSGTFVNNVSDGSSSTVYQMARIMSPSFPFVEVVTNGPWNAVFGSDTVQFYDNGSPYFSGMSAVSISPSGGVTFNVHTPPAAGHVISWTGNFYFPVRFKNNGKNGLKGSKFMQPYWAHTIELESFLQ